MSICQICIGHHLWRHTQQIHIFKDSINARKPVEGTIARNYLSTFYFDGDLEGYLQSGKFAKNPLEINEKNLKEGEALYGMFCAHCHGPEGNRRW